MKKANLKEMTVDELVERFTEIAVAQDQALSHGQYATFNRLYDMMLGVELELKARTGDQRRALLPLYKHPNMQVRLKAATATLAVEPQIARQELEGLASSRLYPQAGDAGMLISGLDDGTFKPT